MGSQQKLAENLPLVIYKYHICTHRVGKENLIKVVCLFYMEGCLHLMCINSHRYIFLISKTFSFPEHFTSWFTDPKCWDNMLNKNVDSFPRRLFCSLGEALLNICFEIWRNLINILLLPIAEYSGLSWDQRSTGWVKLFSYLQPCRNNEVAGISLESNGSQHLSRRFPNQRWLPRSSKGIILEPIKPMAKIPISAQHS